MDSENDDVTGFPWRFALYLLAFFGIFFLGQWTGEKGGYRDGYRAAQRSIPELIAAQEQSDALMIELFDGDPNDCGYAIDLVTSGQCSAYDADDGYNIPYYPNGPDDLR